MKNKRTLVNIDNILLTSLDQAAYNILQTKERLEKEGYKNIHFAMEYGTGYSAIVIKGYKGNSVTKIQVIS